MLEGKELESVMPHKRNMVLITRVVEYSIADKYLIAQVDITEKSMFFKNGQVPVWVGIEYMAQSIAALSGIYQKTQNSDKINIGFIIGARNYKCFVGGFNLGKTLTVKVQELFLDAEIGSFSCEIFDGDKLLAATELNVFQPQSIDGFID
jgi:predicted hotdog family 3-hydroxylacyl-ACP dehydratase